MYFGRIEKSSHWEVLCDINLHSGGGGSRLVALDGQVSIYDKGQRLVLTILSTTELKFEVKGHQIIF